MPHAHMAAGASAHMGHTFSSFTVPDRGDNLRYNHQACIWRPAPQLLSTQCGPTLPEHPDHPCPARQWGASELSERGGDRVFYCRRTVLRLASVL